jgi:hypothetical protein
MAQIGAVIGRSFSYELIPSGASALQSGHFIGRSGGDIHLAGLAALRPFPEEV